MTPEQEREDFEAWFISTGRSKPAIWSSGEYVSDDAKLAFKSWQARAALQSQSVIDDERLSIVLDVYDNAMQKAFDGREFQNPCKHGTPEHKAWEEGSKEGKKKRDAGLPNSIALQSQDREGDPLQPAANWLNEAVVDLTATDIQQRLFVGHNRAQRLLDQARRVEGDGNE